MRLTNKNKAPLYNFITTLLLIIMLLGVLAYFFEMYRLRLFSSMEYVFLLVPSILLLLFYVRGRQIFEYDSDGEALNFKNRGVISGFGKTTNDEFPKYKLLDYDIVNLFFIKKIYVKISSKKNHHMILKYDISYLNEKQIRDLKISLNKVLKANKEANNLNND